MQKTIKNLNCKVVIEVCNALLNYFSKRKECGKIAFIKGKQLIKATKVKKGWVSHAMAHLRKKGIAQQWGKYPGGAWKIDINLLKKELENLKKNGE